MYSNVLIYKELLAWQKSTRLCSISHETISENYNSFNNFFKSNIHLAGVTRDHSELYLWGGGKILKEKVDCRLWYTELLKLESDFFKLVERTGDIITAPGI